MHAIIRNRRVYFEYLCFVFLSFVHRNYILSQTYSLLLFLGISITELPFESALHQSGSYETFVFPKMFECCSEFLRFLFSFALSQQIWRSQENIFKYSQDFFPKPRFSHF